MGQSAAQVDGRDFVTGKHRYPSDQKLPDMLVRQNSAPACFWSDTALGGHEESRTDGRHRGPRRQFCRRRRCRVQELPRRCVAAIHAEWKSEPQPSSKELFDYLKKNTDEGKDPTGDGDRYESVDVDEALASADHRLQQTYTVPTSRMCRSSRALRWRSGTATSLRSGPERSGRLAFAANLPRPFGFPKTGPRAHAGYGIGLWRQTYRGDGDRGGAAGARRRSAR